VIDSFIQPGAFSCDSLFWRWWFKSW